MSYEERRQRALERLGAMATARQDWDNYLFQQQLQQQNADRDAQAHSNDKSFSGFLGGAVRGAAAGAMTGNPYAIAGGAALGGAGYMLSSQQNPNMGGDLVQGGMGFYASRQAEEARKRATKTAPGNYGGTAGALAEPGQMRLQEPGELDWKPRG